MQDRVDLRDMKSVKERMKPKCQNPSATSGNVLLPIKAWYLGRKHFDEPYHIVWINGKLTIRSGEDPNTPSKHTEEIDMGWVAKRVWFIEASEDYKDKVFVVETFQVDKKKTASRKPLGLPYSSYFKQGSGGRGEGDIIFKFDSESPSWTPEFYELFINWVKSIVADREKLRGKAGDSKWEAASRMAQLVASRFERETGETVASERVPKASRAKTPARTPAIPGFPLIDNFSPPASIAISNTAKTRPENQGGPNVPIEVESPTRALKPTDSIVTSTKIMSPVIGNHPHAKEQSWLPIKSWYLGYKFINGPYHLSWSTDGRVSIRSGDNPDVVPQHKEEIYVRWDAKYVLFVEPDELHQDKVFVLETYESPGHNQKAIGSRYPTYFKQGSTALGEGDITIKLDSASPAWADSRYKSFVDWLKAKVNRGEKIGGLAGDSRWETATRMAQLVEARIAREAVNTVLVPLAK
ncbi:hypothetical protein C8F04DRAFT_1311284 [Mycena alexandri]|uniref:Uncharacterized protein n=1 Tax=Mycena alexandri TaxID=1745969 RepID=A0AAD6WT03_9AGAR|nr:hypothetical protein C8F04DRAFT_1311284 [Mycena alexandri]